MLKVLIADDEYLVCQFLKTAIDWQKLDMECIAEAFNGIEAFQMIQELMPDIVITDIRMPGLSGLELIERCRTAGFQCRFIITSGYPDFEYVKTAFTKGAVNYLLKPIDEVELENTLLKIREGIQSDGKNGISERAAFRDTESSSVNTVDYGKWEALFGVLNSDKGALSLGEVNRQYGCCFKEDMEYNVAAVSTAVHVSAKEKRSLYLSLNTRVEEQFHMNITPLCCECQSVIKHDGCFLC